ncbi:COG3650 family protein [Metapseudomonas otitidis]|uniref:COG3650 family protein n=1 Tax=Metapseudomonas otitidis TaxID=319939 RepID=UPI001F1DA4B5|nr:hypothetical protein [Pseudomonas otitidis]
MRIVRPLLFSLIPLFAGCQVFTGPEKTPQLPQQRMQGELEASDGRLVFRPCQEQRRFVITDVGATGILQEAATLLDDGPGPLFADLGGQLGASKAGADGQLDVRRLYRLQREGHGCDDPNFRRLLLRASGNEPSWNVNVSNAGLVLEQPEQPPLAIPYMEEQLPDGRFNLTSEANGRRVELWIAPKRCVDSMSGAVEHLSAELRLDGKTLRGCAAFGGARND